MRDVSKQSFGAGVLVSACAGNRGWGYADSNDGRREVLPRIPLGLVLGGSACACVCVVEGAAGWDLCNDPNAPYVSVG